VGAIASVKLSEHSAGFRIETEQSAHQLILFPIGEMNEDVNFSEISQLILNLNPSVKNLLFDLRGVQSLNSGGVRSWILFIEQVRSRYACQFKNVNELFVEQASMLTNFFGRNSASIESFEGPYFCSHCKTRTIHMLKPTDVRMTKQSFTPPSFKCEQCDGDLEFDALEDEYFNFMRNVKT